MYGFGVGREGQRQTNADAAAAVALVLGREEGQKPPSELLAA